MSNANSEWVLPARIPFAKLKAKDLEECVYWLLDAIGARDLEWRVGGAGSGAADGGRDLEATFYTSLPDGEMAPEKWWIECKGRTTTVDPDEVKRAINNSTARADLACVVIATNTTFSNPTRDWVSEWQKGHPRPRVKLWDHTNLERLLSRQPGVVSRLFAEALSIEGRLEAAREHFWNKIEFCAETALAQFWKERAGLAIGALERFALITSEFALGDIDQRPWAGECPVEQLFETMQIGLANLPYLALRARLSGTEDHPITRALAYLVLASPQHVSADEMAALLAMLLGERDGQVFPEYVRETLTLPLMGQINSELCDVCSSDCERMMSADRQAFTESGDQIADYWYRFDATGKAPPDPARKILLLENTRASCQVGFAVDENIGCPLFRVAPTLDNLAERLAVFKRVSAYRLKQAHEKMKGAAA